MGLTKRRYALHMLNGAPTIEGLLIRKLRHEFVLIDAKLLEGEDRTHSMAGPVTVLRENVFCLQEIK